MHDLVPQIEEAAARIRRDWRGTAQVGIILGTGLGGVVADIQAEATFSCHDLPHFPRATAIGHAGNLLCGRIGGVSVAAMEGRFHVYEGYTFQQVTFPVRVMKALGAELLIVSNASGGLNPRYRLGDVMFIDDHINLMGGNPLVGVNDDRLGPRFPDMARPYDQALIELGLAAAGRNNFTAHRGVYVGVMGPNLETRAEYRFLRAIGADAVGMSTVPEVIVAVHAGMRVLGLSVVTNECDPDALEPCDVGQILATAAAAERKLRDIILDALTYEAKRTPRSLDNHPQRSQ